MSEKKSFPKKYKAQLTPKGAFKFPALNVPDVYKGVAKYKNRLLVTQDDPEVQAFIEKLERIRDEEVERVKAELIAKGKKGLANKVAVRDVFKEDLDKEGEPTGFIAFDASMKAEYKDKKSGQTKQRRPKFFDARGREIKRNIPEIWGGTIGRMGVDIMGSERPGDGAIGVTLYLDAVFLLELKTGGARSAGDYGFQGEDGGYAYDDEDGDDDDSGYGSFGNDAASDDEDDTEDF